jgi:tRNA A37 threonylcarbamoyladenosine dehydratase
MYSVLQHFSWRNLFISNKSSNFVAEMEDQFTRTRMLLGETAIERLGNSHVAVFGVGGVGGQVVEVLARSGVGHLDLIDNDEVNLTNLNRQIIALHSTIGRKKVEVAAERVRDINPHCEVKTWAMFYLPENADNIDLKAYDYVVDCIDTVAAKMELIRRCHQLGVRLISCMGAANKMNPAGFRVADLSKTQIDPLAKVIRKKLRKEGIEHVKVVYSEEEPMTPVAPQSKENGHPLPASNAFVPAAAGLVCGGEVVKALIGFKECV